jgi:hypothetical protein
MRNSKPADVPRKAHLYVFDPNKVRKGDIFLTTAPGSMRSVLISRATRGIYSHAAICTEENFLLEATGLGVSRVFLTRISVTDLRNINQSINY